MSWWCNNWLSQMSLLHLQGTRCKGTGRKVSSRKTVYDRWWCRKRRAWRCCWKCLSALLKMHHQTNISWRRLSTVLWTVQLHWDWCWGVVTLHVLYLVMFFLPPIPLPSWYLLDPSSRYTGIFKMNSMQGISSFCLIMLCRFLVDQ